MINAFSSIVGNRSLCQRLAHAIDGNSLSHAYIIEGAAGSGRHTIALHALAAASCKERGVAGASLPCKKCSFCKKILEGKSADVINVEREEGKATIGVETMRFLKSDIYLPPTELSYKAIGESFGKDHSTVLYSCRQIEKFMTDNAFERDTINDIIKNLKSE